MWKVAVLVSLLLHMGMQVNGAADKTKGSVAGKSRPEKKVRTEEAEATNTIPVSNTASSGFVGNLLVVPMDGSHWVDIKVLVQELGRRGHRVTVVIPEFSMRMGPGKHYDTVIYPIPYDKAYLDAAMASHKDFMEKSTDSFTEKIRKKYAQIQTFFEIIHSTAESLLFNASVISHLAQQVSTKTKAEHNIRISCEIQ